MPTACHAYYTVRERVYSWSGPVLAIYPTPKLLDAIDALPCVTDVLAIPWVGDELSHWVKTWSASNLGAGPEKAAHHINPILAVALENLTGNVNGLHRHLAPPGPSESHLTVPHPAKR